MDKVIKVLHVTQALGGVKRYIENILENQISGFEHILISPDKDFNRISSERDIVVKSFTVKIQREPGINDLRALIKIVRIIKTEQPDIIHAHSAKGGVLGRFSAFLTKKPCIFTPNGFSYLSFSGLKRQIFLLIEKCLCPITSTLLAVGASEASIAKKIGFKKNKVVTIFNATSIPKESISSYHLKRKIGTIGRLTYQKNPLEFARLAKEINSHFDQKIEFVILGAGFHDHLKPELVSYLERNNLKDYFTILDWDENYEVKDFYNDLDIFVLTSTFEGLPFSLLEAMSIGLASIVSNTPGTKDALNHSINGFIYEDFNSLVHFTNNLLSSESLRKRIGMNARDSIVKDFNVLNKSKEIHNLYSSISR